ncbi:MAG: peptide ABC transporter substrate-binding protein [Chthoniobacterales bacterium]|nr:peptide ABC transporter substrate-binding protein [Chthoniobacterales bacterium]
MKNVVYLLLFLFVGGMSAFLVGCHDRHQKADLVFINGVEPDSLDPALITGQADGRIVSELFEGLLRFNRAGMAEPGVAALWEISPDKKIYLFHLRPSARWSDGRTVTAADFVTSWKRMLQPTTAAPYRDQFFIIEGAEEFASGKDHDFSHVGIEALDEQTLKVTLKNPTAYFLQLCALWPFFPVRSDLIERVGDNWIRPQNLINNGSYSLSAWNINDKITLKKNPFYWDALHVALNTIDVLPIDQANVAYNFYATGVADLIMSKGLVPPSLLDALKKKPDFHASPFLGTSFIRFNCTKPPFQDPRIRQAFALVIDRHRITEKITRGGELCAESFVPPGIPGYKPPGLLGYDPVRARHLLAEAGYPNGKNFPLTNFIYVDGAISEGMAVELQAMWRQELGVSILLARREAKTYLSSMNTLDFNMANSNWIGDYLDPNTFLEIFVTGSGNNRTGWSSPTYDQLLMAASLEPDATKRFSLLREAEELLIVKEAPIVPLFFNMEMQLYDSKKFKGIEGNLLDKHPLWELVPVQRTGKKRGD